MFNKNALKAKVAENGLTMGRLASMLGINDATMSRKMSGISDFKRSEIHEIILALNLSSADVNRIFFAEQLT